MKLICLSFVIETIKICIELGKALKGELYVEKLQFDGAKR